MSQALFLKNSALIIDALSTDNGAHATYSLGVSFPLTRFAVGQWIKMGAVASASFFNQAPETPAEEEDPIIEPLLAERDDEMVTPPEDPTPPTPEEEEEEEEAASVEPPEPVLESEMAPLLAPGEVDPLLWREYTEAIDHYFSYINRLTLFSPEMHKATWQQFTDEAERILSLPTLTHFGLRQRFVEVDKLYRQVAGVA